MKKFTGVMTALVTPFKNGEVDYKSLSRLLKQQLDGKIEGVVVAGTTGEAATMTVAEREKLLERVVSEIAGQVPVVMGSGTFNTRETVELVGRFAKYKPDGFLVVTPYYSKPPQRGMAAHFKAAAQATNLPVILYNVPSRTGCTLLPETVVQIAKENSNVVAVKEAAGDLKVVEQLKKICAADFLVLSGDDATFLPAVDMGAHGVISVISNVIPAWCVSSCAKAARHSDVEAMNKDVAEIASVLFCESNPIPVKWALARMGVIDSDEVRLPLVTLAKNYEPVVTSVLKKWKVL